MSLNSVNIMGNLTRDPELKYTPAGKSVCSMSIANNRVFTKNGEKVQEVLKGLQGLRESLLAEQGALTAKKEKADSERLQLEQRNDYLEGVKQSKATLLTKTTVEATKYDALVDDLEKERESIEDEIESIEAGKIEDLETGNPQPQSC